jgi:Tol biopolymer transport system component
MPPVRPTKYASPALRASTAPIHAASGHLLFGLNAKLMAQAFDAGSGRVQGEPFVVGDPPAPTTFTGAPPGSVSRTGVLAWTTGQPGSNRLAYLALDGRMDAVPGIPERSGASLAVSRDGRYAMVTEALSGVSDLWLIDLARGLANRLTTGTEVAESGAFMPDSRSFLFGSDREGSRRFYRRRIDGTGGDSLVFRSPAPFKEVLDVTPDGAEFLFQQVSGDSGWDLYAARFDSPQPRPVIVTRHHESQGRLSPDGRWLAWLSDESGTNEVYVAAYPGITGKHRISRGAFSPPLWSPDGRTIWFVQGAGNMTTAARFDPATGEVATPQELNTMSPGILDAEILPDDRFLVIQSPQRASGEIVIAIDWLSTQPAASSTGRKRAR